MKKDALMHCDCLKGTPFQLYTVNKIYSDNGVVATQTVGQQSDLHQHQTQCLYSAGLM